MTLSTTDNLGKTVFVTENAAFYLEDVRYVAVDETQPRTLVFFYNTETIGNVSVEDGKRLLKVLGDSK